MVESYTTGGLSAVAKFAKSYQTVNTKIDALQDRLRTQKATTMSDTIAISDSYGWLNLAMGISGLADQALQKKVSNENEAARQARNTALAAWASDLPPRYWPACSASTSRPVTGPATPAATGPPTSPSG